MAVYSSVLTEILKSMESGELNVNSIFSWEQYKEISVLQFAILNSCDELIDFLLENYVDLNISTKFLGTALHLAIKIKKLDIVKKLVSSGADINIMSSLDENLPPLHRAIESGAYEIVEFLVNSGADINLVAYNTLTLGFYSWQISSLNLAIFLTNIPVIELLLKHNAIIDQGSNQIPSTLHLALLGFKNLEILQILDKFGAKFEIIKDGEFTVEFRAAIEQDSVEIFKLFAKKCDNFWDIYNLRHETIAYHVIVFGSKNILRYLLDSGVNVDVVDRNDFSLLDVAVEMYFLKTHNYGIEDDMSLEIIKIIENHIIMLSAAGLYFNKKNSKVVNSEDLKPFREKCEKEINGLKSRKISDTNFNYFDVIVKNLHRLAVGLKHSDFCFVEDKILAEFPVYGSLMIEKLRRAIERKELLKNAAELYDIFYMVLPDLVIRNICNYLNNEDLKLLSQ
ncbi:putative ankyrin repeat protein RF_0381 [Cotesia glomerata]|uniref:putative ankyrin repeat protein RF_0381 n=1 Tax=Cotesia glomerata TaxID=32391 RepID=UPI001D007FAF|nr:putative ankyrin repeat protein RF_0381 [Cotesia glomerata]